MDGEASIGQAAADFRVDTNSLAPKDLVPFGEAPDASLPEISDENSSPKAAVLDPSKLGEADPPPLVPEIDKGTETGTTEETPVVVEPKLTPEQYQKLSDKEKVEHLLKVALDVVESEKENGFYSSPESTRRSEVAVETEDAPDGDHLKALLGSLAEVSSGDIDNGNKTKAQDAYEKLSHSITITIDGKTWSLEKLDEIYGTADEVKRKEIDRIKSEGRWGHKYPKKPETDTRTDGQVISNELKSQIKRLEDEAKGLDKNDPRRKKIEEQLDALKLAEPANGELNVLVSGGALRAVDNALISEFGVGLSERTMESIRAEEHITTTKFMEIMNLRGLNAVSRAQLLEYVQTGRVRELLSQKGIVDANLINKIYGKNFKTESDANAYLESLLSPAQYAELKKLGKGIGLAAIILLISGKLIAGAGNEMAFDRQR